MPQGVYTDIRCYGKIQKPLLELLPHQVETRDFFIKSQEKGLLLFHKLGSGKTCTSISIAEEMLKRKLITEVYVLTPGSLRENFVYEFCNKCGTKDNMKYYTFITYNYAVGRMLPENFDNSLVIIDEVHMFINSVGNSSLNASLLYNTIKRSNCRVLAMTGTPIYHKIESFYYLGLLLKPDVYRKLRKSEFLGFLSGNDTKYFYDLFSNIISFFPGAGQDYYPEVIHMPPIRVLLSKQYEGEIISTTENENKRRGIAMSKIKKGQPLNELDIVALKYITSRSMSNFVYPVYLRLLKIKYNISKIEEKIFNNIKKEKRKSSVSYLIDSEDREDKESSENRKSKLEKLRIDLVDMYKNLKKQSYEMDKQIKLFEEKRRNENIPNFGTDQDQNDMMKMFTEIKNTAEEQHKLLNKNKKKDKPIDFFLKVKKSELIQDYDETTSKLNLEIIEDGKGEFSDDDGPKIGKEGMETMAENQLNSVPDVFKYKGGWMPNDIFDDGSFCVCSPKMSALLINVVNYPKEKQVIFSYFKDKSGVMMLKAMLEKCDFKTLLFTGDIDDKDRMNILDKFNSKKNRYGDVCQVLLCTEAGAQGINLLEVRHLHILESSTRETIIQQMMGRVARYKSHIDMPKDERNVKIWRYFLCWAEEPCNKQITYFKKNKEGHMILTEEKVAIGTKMLGGIDQLLYYQGQEQIKEIDKFYDTLKRFNTLVKHRKLDPAYEMTYDDDAKTHKGFLKKMLAEKRKDEKEGKKIYELNKKEKKKKDKIIERQNEEIVEIKEKSPSPPKNTLDVFTDDDDDTSAKPKSKNSSNKPRTSSPKNSSNKPKSVSPKNSSNKPRTSKSASSIISTLKSPINTLDVFTEDDDTSVDPKSVSPKNSSNKPRTSKSASSIISTLKSPINTLDVFTDDDDTSVDPKSASPKNSSNKPRTSKSASSIISTLKSLNTLDVFTDDDEDDIDEKKTTKTTEKIVIDNSRPEGLVYVKNFLNDKECKQLMIDIDKESWDNALKRRTQHYGFRYDYKSRNLPEQSQPIPKWCEFVVNRIIKQGLMDVRPDQLIINEYEPGQGISAHIDQPRIFGPQVVSISLGSTCVMDFERNGVKYSILLEIGSAVSLSGPARYDWTHSIIGRKTDIVDGKKLNRQRRVSLTFRSVTNLAKSVK